MKKIYQNIFIKTWEKADSELSEKVNSKLMVFIFIYTAFALSVIRYFSDIDYVLMIVSGSGLTNKSELNDFQIWFCSFFYNAKSGTLHQSFWWASVIVVFYLIIPAIILKSIFKYSLKDFGFNLNGIKKDYSLYFIMLLIMIPIVYVASFSVSFQQKYPLFKPEGQPLMPSFLYWQLAYFVQFIGLEFFFRGFLIHGLKPKFGSYSILISMVPYCMIHFGKPFPETIAAILAGIVLGTLSIKSRSILLGILIHYSVAITMDLMALYRSGELLLK